MTFHEVPIGDTFYWRNANWFKVGPNHAVSADAQGNEDPEHVPSHDEVTIEAPDDSEND